MGARKKSLINNLSWNYICSAAELVVYFLLTPYIINFLGGTVYGIWILVKSIMFCLRFLNLNIYGSIIKYVSEYSERKDFDKENKVIGIALRISIITGLITLLCSILAAVFIVPKYFHLPDGFGAEARMAVVCFGFMLLFEFPGNVVAGIFGGRQRFDVISIIYMARLFLAAVATYFFLNSGYGLLSIIIVEVVSTVLDIIFNCVMLKKMFPEISLNIYGIKGELWQKLRDFSFWSTANAIFIEGGVEIHKLIIPILLPVSMVTPYSIICTIASGILLLIRPASFSFLPVSSANNASGRDDKQNYLLIKGTKYMVGISLAIAVAIIVYGESFISHWLKNRDIEIPNGILYMMVISYVISAFMSTGVTIMRAMEKVKQVFWMSFCQFFGSLTLIFFVTPRYGLHGFAASVLVANLVVTLFWTMPYVCRLLNESLKSFLLQGLLKPLLALVPVLLLVPGLDAVVDSRTLLNVLIKSTVVSVTYLAGFCLLTLSVGERKEVYHHVGGLLT